MLLSFIIVFLATCLFPVPALALNAAATTSGAPAVAPKDACPPGECCEFKLRIYQRCVLKDNYGTKDVQTWPLFYDFLDKNRETIQPITGDYNTKACYTPECDKDSVGNITGPGDFYMRWEYKEHPEYDGGKVRGEMTYWYGNVDHMDYERCMVEDWTDYPGEVTRWANDCEEKENVVFSNRTRVCSC
jgi:hypothetical protein